MAAENMSWSASMYLALRRSAGSNIKRLQVCWLCCGSEKKNTHHNQKRAAGIQMMEFRLGFRLCIFEMCQKKYALY